MTCIGEKREREKERTKAYARKITMVLIVNK